MRRLLAVAIAALAIAGCGFVPGLADRPTACVEVYSQDQCLAMIDMAAAQVSRNRGDVTGIVIVPDPPPEGVSLGGAWPIRVRIGFVDGTTHETRLCGGLSIAAACMDEPRLSSSSVIGAYTDVPCATEAPDSCATPHPSLEPEAATTAEPLVVDSLAIPIDHDGPYEVVVGEATLPNGILTQASFEWAEAWPADVALAEARGFLEVRSLEPDGKPFDNYYLHGWRPGVERVRVVLVFDVLWHQPGAALAVRNIFVR